MIIDHGDIGAAVCRLERELPGWWWSIGWCHVSSDCTIAVDGSPGSPDIHLVCSDDPRFNEGFQNDIVGDDVAAALNGAIDDALAAKAALTSDEIETARAIYAKQSVIPFMRGHGAIPALYSPGSPQGMAMKKKLHDALAVACATMDGKTEAE